MESVDPVGSPCGGSVPLAFERGRAGPKAADLPGCSGRPGRSMRRGTGPKTHSCHQGQAKKLGKDCG